VALDGYYLGNHRRNMGPPMNFRTRPRGEQLSFLTECWKCAGELSITNGRVDRHDCGPRPIALATE